MHACSYLKRDLWSVFALGKYFSLLIPSTLVILVVLVLVCWYSGLISLSTVAISLGIRGLLRGNPQGKDFSGFQGYLDGIVGNPSLTQIR